MWALTPGLSWERFRPRPPSSAGSGRPGSIQVGRSRPQARKAAVSAASHELDLGRSDDPIRRLDQPGVIGVRFNHTSPRGSPARSPPAGVSSRSSRCCVFRIGARELSISWATGWPHVGRQDVSRHGSVVASYAYSNRERQVWRRFTPEPAPAGAQRPHKLQSRDCRCKGLCLPWGATTMILLPTARVDARNFRRFPHGLHTESLDARYCSAPKGPQLTAPWMYCRNCSRLMT